MGQLPEDREYSLCEFCTVQENGTRTRRQTGGIHCVSSVRSRRMGQEPAVRSRRMVQGSEDREHSLCEFCKVQKNGTRTSCKVQENGTRTRRR